MNIFQFFEINTHGHVNILNSYDPAYLPLHFHIIVAVARSMAGATRPQNPNTPFSLWEFMNYSRFAVKNCPFGSQRTYINH